MVKRKIIYTIKAQESLKKILVFYKERNNSNVYSKKLLDEIKDIILLLLTNPELGIKVNNNQILRVLIKKNYKIFYEIKINKIEILLIWDCRQNPDDLKI